MRQITPGPAIGGEIGGYRIDSLLGQGGMGAVYVATHVRLRRRAAIKLLLPGYAADEDFRERFIRESQAAASLDHPNIVPVYDADEEQGVLYIAMRYVEGEDLGSLLKREGRLAPERALAVIEQAASALDAAHASGLVHRDVKPANILLGAPGEHVYLTDFGVAKHATAPGLTRTGSFIGTVDYSAPEQIEGKDVDGRTDVYALGCVLYECLTGRPPFAKDSEVAVLHAHLLEPAPAPSLLRAELSQLDEVIATALAKRRDERYPVCTELALAFRKAIAKPARAPLAATEPAPARLAATRERPPALPAPVPRVEEPGPRPRRRRWPLAVITIAVVPAAAAVALVLTRGGEDTQAGERAGSVRAVAPPPRPPAPVASRVSLRQGESGLTATISLAGGSLNAAGLIRRDTAIADGSARIELSQPGISTKVNGKSLGGVVIAIRPGTGRLVVTVTTKRGAFEALEARRGAGGRSVLLVLTRAAQRTPPPSSTSPKPSPTSPPVPTTPAPTSPAPTRPTTPTPEIG